jgi:hypothetical protein
MKTLNRTGARASSPALLSGILLISFPGFSLDRKFPYETRNNFAFLCHLYEFVRSFPQEAPARNRSVLQLSARDGKPFLARVAK